MFISYQQPRGVVREKRSGAKQSRRLEKNSSASLVWNTVSWAVGIAATAAAAFTTTTTAAADMVCMPCLQKKVMHVY